MTRKILTWLVLLIMLSTVAVAGSVKEIKNKVSVVPWQDYHPAMATGKAESKPILLHFTTGRNEASETMKLKTYSQPKVARYLMENFATGWIDLDVYPALGKKYEVDTSMTLWFLDSRGKSLTSVDGYLGPEKMLLVLEFINTKSYQKMSYEDWKDERPRR